MLYSTACSLISGRFLVNDNVVQQYVTSACFNYPFNIVSQRTDGDRYYLFELTCTSKCHEQCFLFYLDSTVQLNVRGNLGESSCKFSK